MAKQQLFTQIVNTFKDQNRADIDKWRRALLLANHIESPRIYALQDLYDNLERDGHFSAQKNVRKGATFGYGFSIVDKKTGDINNEKTEIFNAGWFYDFMDAALESIFRGYTVLELVDPAAMHFELIPRRNVSGTQQTVLLNVLDNKGINIAKGFEHTLIKIGKPSSLGILADLCGMLIWKRNAMQSWAEFTEKFGMPLIVATTNKTRQADIDRVMSMVRVLGEAARATLPEGTKIEVIPFATGDSFNVYDKQIERINTEISKPVTGGTMITDDGSSRSQSEVHERTLDAKIAEGDRRMIQFLVNNQLIPIMHYWGHDLNPDTDKFLFDTSFELSLLEHWNIVNQVWQRADIPPEWISKTFNVPIDKVHDRNEFALPFQKLQSEPEDDSLSRSFR
jgi:phage gp29-like protein